MLKVRLIPVLLLKENRMVKPIQFGEKGERDVGSPITTAKVYASQDADELIFLDIEATRAGKTFLLETLRAVAVQSFVPLTAGGGMRTIEDIVAVLRSGADKVSLNTSAVQDPELITRAANTFGSQCIIVSIDAKEMSPGKYEVFTHGGKKPTGMGVYAWSREVVQRGAGEILLTAIDREGTMTGYNVELIKKVADMVTVPVIANGGAGTRQDFVDAVQIGHASAVAASSVFHFSDSNLTQVKSFMFNAGIPVRPI